MKKLFIFLSILTLCNFIFSQTQSNNEIDPEILSFVDELNDEDYLKEIEKISEIKDKLSSISTNKQVIDYTVYTDKMVSTNTDDFKVKKLSEKLEVMSQNAKITNALVSDFTEKTKSNLKVDAEQLALVSELISHTNNVITIMNKILETQGDALSSAITSLAEAQAYVSDALNRVELLGTQISLLNEALAYQEVKNKRAWITGNIGIAVCGGISIFTSALLVANSNDGDLVSPSFATSMLYSSIIATVGCELIWNGGHLIFKWW